MHNTITGKMGVGGSAFICAYTTSRNHGGNRDVADLQPREENDQETDSGCEVFVFFKFENTSRYSMVYISHINFKQIDGRKKDRNENWGACQGPLTFFKA